jgi:hypothetical protein
MAIDKSLLAMLGEIQAPDKLKFQEADLSLFLKELPPAQRKGRGLSKEMLAAQRVIKEYHTESRVWYPVKVCKSNGIAQSTASNMRKSPHWTEFEIEARNGTVYARLLH